ncbi:MAG TPA: hypothetical protein VEG65_02020 [Candidatus Bathyarchaeia archaeon]|nr:hypothetical protein [Candidatus Bathyarchaeia archaeon]
MNFQSLRRISVVYLIFLALCIPLAIPIGGPVQVFCAGAVLLFFPGFFTSLVILGEQSLAGRIGTSIGFSVVFMALLEVVYTALSIPGSPLTVVAPLFVLTTLMFVFALALHREQAPISASAFLKPENIIIVALLIFGAITRLWYPLTVGTIPYFDPLYWATRAAYFVHTGFTGIPSFLSPGASDLIRERSFEFTTGSFAMIGNTSVVDTAIWYGPVMGVLAAIMLLAVLERLEVSLAGKVVALFLWGSMSPLFEVFWRTDISIMQVVGTFFVFFGLYLCASQDVSSFLAGAFVLGFSIDIHILYGVYTPFIFALVVIAQLVKRQGTLTAIASIPTYVLGLMLFAWRFLVYGIPSGFSPALITSSTVPFAMQSVLPVIALQLMYPAPTYILQYVTPLIAALAIVALTGSLIDIKEWELSHLVLLAFVLGTFAGWILSTLYFSFDPATAEIFLGRGVAYGQAVLIPAAGLGVTMIERYLGRRSALISPGRVIALVLVVLILLTNVGAAVSTDKYQNVIGQDDFNAIRYVAQIPSNHTRLAFFARPNPSDPFANASSSQREALFYTANPSTFDSSPMAYRDEVSNSTAAMQAAIQSDRSFYNYVILSENLGSGNQTALDNYLRSNGYTAVTRFGDTYIYTTGSAT